MEDGGFFMMGLLLLVRIKNNKEMVGEVHRQVPDQRNLKSNSISVKPTKVWRGR